mgnify:CR=1 FL=1
MTEPGLEAYVIAAGLLFFGILIVYLGLQRRDATMRSVSSLTELPRRPEAAEPVSMSPRTMLDGGGSDAARAAYMGNVVARIGLKIVWALAAFLLCLIISSLMVLAVLYLIHGPRYSPNPARFGGVLIGALFAAFWGWKRAPAPDQVLSFCRRRIELLGWPVRLAIAVAVPWAIFILVAVYEFEWLGYYWRGSEYVRFWLALIGPPLLAPLIVQLWNWALRKT